MCRLDVMWWCCRTKHTCICTCEQHTQTPSRQYKSRIVVILMVSSKIVFVRLGRKKIMARSWLVDGMFDRFYKFRHSVVWWIVVCIRRSTFRRSKKFFFHFSIIEFDGWNEMQLTGVIFYGLSLSKNWHPFLHRSLLHLICET